MNIFGWIHFDNSPSWWIYRPIWHIDWTGCASEALRGCCCEENKVKLCERRARGPLIIVSPRNLSAWAPVQSHWRRKEVRRKESTFGHWCYFVFSPLCVFRCVTIGLPEKRYAEEGEYFVWAGSHLLIETPLRLQFSVVSHYPPNTPANTHTHKKIRISKN